MGVLEDLVAQEVERQLSEVRHSADLALKEALGATIGVSEVSRVVGTIESAVARLESRVAAIESTDGTFRVGGNATP